MMHCIHLVKETKYPPTPSQLKSIHKIIPMIHFHGFIATPLFAIKRATLGHPSSHL